jgi:hypothetical protein
MTALGEAVISGSAFGGGPTTPASPRRLLSPIVIPERDEIAYPGLMNTGI